MDDYLEFHIVMTTLDGGARLEKEMLPWYFGMWKSWDRHLQYLYRRRR